MDNSMETRKYGKQHLAQGHVERKYGSRNIHSILVGQCNASWPLSCLGLSSMATSTLPYLALSELHSAISDADADADALIPCRDYRAYYSLDLLYSAKFLPANSSFHDCLSTTSSLSTVRREPGRV